MKERKKKHFISSTFVQSKESDQALRLYGENEVLFLIKNTHVFILLINVKMPKTVGILTKIKTKFIISISLSLCRVTWFPSLFCLFCHSHRFR